MTIVLNSHLLFAERRRLLTFEIFEDLPANWARAIPVALETLKEKISR